MILLLLLAIIVVGPKDLPKLMRTLGGLMAKVKALGAEFRQAFEEMGAEEELKELREQIAELKNVVPTEDLDLTKEMRGLDTELREATRMPTSTASGTASDTASGP